MATSIHTCLPGNSCKQHELPSLRVLNGATASRSPSFLRQGGSSARYNAANRRSAVERLEESKANYVKSERVLDSRQEFKHSSHLQVTSTGPQLDFLIKAPLKLLHSAPPDAPVRSPSAYEFLDLTKLSPPPNSLPVGVSGSGLQRVPSIKQAAILRPKSPAPIRARAKSQSEVRDSHSRKKLTLFRQSTGRSTEEIVDLELQLKRLIAAGSRENVSQLPAPVESSSSSSLSPPECTKVRRGYSDPLQKDSWSYLRQFHDKNYSVHKSMPDLSPSRYALSRRRADSSDSSSEASTSSSERLFKPRSRTTSDYVSRSSSFKHSPVKSMHNFGFSNDHGGTSLKPGDLTCSREWSEDSLSRRRPVLRSKSDVSQRVKSQPDLLQKRNGHSSSDLERFFDMMGLDSMVWRRITSPPSPSTPPRYFESVSSYDSDDQRSSFESGDSDSPKDGIRNQDLADHGPVETSIIEKNARVIKWLFNCRKAVVDPGS